MSKLSIIILAFAAALAYGQAVRVDQPLMVTGPNVPTTQGPLPQALFLANATVSICQHPASLAACIPVVTYTDSTEATQCPVNAQMTQAPGSACTGSAGSIARVGFWYGGGLVDYIISSVYGTWGPYSITGAAINNYPCPPNVANNVTCSGYGTFGGVIAPGNPDSDPLQNTFIGNYAGISGFSECANNPGISFGSAGAFDAGSVRDSKILFVNGTYYEWYTGAASATSPYNPTIGLATSTDGCHWTKQGQVIAPNASVADCAGAVFSPGAYYQASTSILYMYVSCANTGAEWYTGPIYIAQLHVSGGPANWGNPADYVWDNGGNPIITATQAWEGAQGVYAADVYLVGATYYMLYSSNTSGTLYQWGIATSASPDFTTNTKSSTNPITPSGSNYEEPSCALLENGNIVCFGDPVQAKPYINVIDYTGGSLLAAANWDQQAIFTVPGSATWSGAEVGSDTVAESPDGRWLMGYDGKATGSGTDARTIGHAWFKFSPSQNQPYSNSLLTNAIYFQNPLGFTANNYGQDFFSSGNYSGLCTFNINSGLTALADTPFCTGTDSILGPITRVAGAVDLCTGSATDAATCTTAGGFSSCPANGGQCVGLSAATLLQEQANQITGVLVSALPAAATSNAGTMQVVTDSTSVVTEGQTCVGSSTHTALAFSNGSVWKCF
jgi:hypothetical protein